MKRSAGTRAGFTLIETLAALAVSASIFVVAAALLHHVAFSFDRGVLGANEAERFALAMERLSRDFAAARFVFDGPRIPGATQAAPIAFIGEATRIVFVSASAAGAKAAPEETLVFTVETDRDGASRLMRRRRPWNGPREGLLPEQAGDVVILLEGRYDISFSFAGPDTKGAASWREIWRNESKPPRLVRLVLRDSSTGASLVPRAEFVLRADAPASCATEPETCPAGASESREPPRREPT
jgi:prepilin-type N-terminal cleavage/methylation domain-containing protein